MNTTFQLTQPEHTLVILFAKGYSISRVAGRQNLKGFQMREAVDRIESLIGFSLTSQTLLREWLPVYHASLASESPRDLGRLRELRATMVALMMDVPSLYTAPASVDPAPALVDDGPPLSPSPSSVPSMREKRERRKAAMLERMLDAPLSPSEKNIQDALAEGMTLEEIAGNLVLSPRDFAALVSSLEAKTGTVLFRRGADMADPAFL